MPLSCSCDWGDYEPEPGEWEIDWYTGKELDFEPFRELRRKRCISCKELIDWDSLCLKFARARHPYDEIEARINGVDWECWEEPRIKISPVYHCEQCGEIYLNLDSVGFECIYPTENMPEMLKDYQIEYAGPKLLTEEERELKLSKMKSVAETIGQTKRKKYQKD